MRWDELTPTDFLELRRASGGFCVLPVASLERHGNHLPLGMDSFVAEEVCRRAAGLEPMMVFPVLRFGVNGEAAANPPSGPSRSSRSWRTSATRSPATASGSSCSSPATGATATACPSSCSSGPPGRASTWSTTR
jgi:creatinine amidohydrolase